MKWRLDNEKVHAILMRSTKKQPEDSIDDKIKDITRNGEVKRGAPKKIRTLGGDCECRWDESTRVHHNVNGHLAAFSQFLECGGLLDRLLSGSPFATQATTPPPAEPC